MPRAQFKVQDLLVDVVAPNLEQLGQYCIFPTRVCKYLTLHCPRNTFIFCAQGGVTLDPCGRGITLDCLITDGCGLNYSTCYRTELFVIDVKTLIINPADVDTLRKEVDTLLDAVGTRAREVSLAMQPQNLAQTELLEQQLEAALKEIQGLKGRFG